MIKNKGIVEGAVRVIDAEINSAFTHFKSQLPDEPEFTGYLLGRLDASLQHYKSRGLVWYTLPTRNTQETPSGADGIILIEYSLEDYKLAKCLMFQAKKLDSNGQPTKGSNNDRLLEQCNKMLGATPASFVFGYSPSRFYVFPASGVQAAEKVSTSDIYFVNQSVFFKGFLQCFIGDIRLGTEISQQLKKSVLANNWFMDSIEKVKQEYKVNNLTYIIATDNPAKHPLI